jgi:hypothetical protein
MCRVRKFWVFIEHERSRNESTRVVFEQKMIRQESSFAFSHSLGQKQTLNTELSGVEAAVL